MDELTYWAAAFAVLMTFGPALVWLAQEMTRPGPLLPPYGRQVVSTDGSTVPLDGSLPVRVVSRGVDPYARFVPAPEVYEGRHRPEVLDHSWPAAEVRQICGGTGEYAIVDVLDARWNYELVGSGDRR